MNRFLSLCAAGLIGFYSNVSAQNGFSDKEKLYLDSMINTYSNMPYSSSSFRKELGAILKATRDDGIKYLTNYSDTAKVEDAWAFVPKHDLWINASSNSFYDSVHIDRGVINFALLMSEDIEVYHTHLYKTLPQDKIFFQNFEEYGEIVRYVPSSKDVGYMLRKAYEFPEKKITHGVVSRNGVMSMSVDPLILKHPNFLEYAMVLKDGYGSWLAEHFKKLPVSDFEAVSKSLEDIGIKAEFKYYSR